MFLKRFKSINEDSEERSKSQTQSTQDTTRRHKRKRQLLIIDSPTKKQCTYNIKSHMKELNI